MTEREKQRLEKISAKLEQIKAQRQDILTREKKRQRKERTHRLIQIGALSEKYFDMKDIQPVEYEKFLKLLLTNNEIKENIANFSKNQRINP